MSAKIIKRVFVKEFHEEAATNEQEQRKRFEEVSSDSDRLGERFTILYFMYRILRVLQGNLKGRRIVVL